MENDDNQTGTRVKHRTMVSICRPGSASSMAQP